MLYSRLASHGSYLPKKILTNAELEKMVDTSDDWIVQRTGISTRHISSDLETTSYMASCALNNAMERGNFLSSDIDGIIVATTTADKALPSVACHVACEIGANNAFAFDIQVACTGFIYALSLADSMIKCGKAKNIAVIGAERMSSIVNWSDRNTCVLFGDGAGVIILSASNSEVGIIDSHISADNSLCNILQTNQNRHIEMDGKNVFKYATEQMSLNLLQILEKNKFKVEDLSSVIAHQANYRILSYVAKKLNVSEDIFPMTMKYHGNTSAASVPLAFDYWHGLGKIKSGDLIAMQAVGAGMTIGTLIVRM